MASILLDDALAAGGLQTAAELVGIARGPERPHHGAVIDTLRAEIDAPTERLAVPELPGKLGLQAAEGGLRVSLAPLRGDLDHIAAARRGGRNRGKPRRPLRCCRWYRRDRRSHRRRSHQA